MFLGIWVGNDDNTPMRNVTGGGLPARMWAQFTASALGVRSLGTPPPRETRRADTRRASPWQSLRKRWFGGGGKKHKQKKGKKH